MRVALFSAVIGLVGLTTQADAQCPAPAYGRVYSGYVPYGAYYAPSAGYAPYGTYAPYRAQLPSYPAYSGVSPAPSYGTQSTYFRGQPGSFAAPGGTFFGGYDYQIGYPPDWYGGYWTWR